MARRCYTVLIVTLMMIVGLTTSPAVAETRGQSQPAPSGEYIPSQPKQKVPPAPAPAQGVKSVRTATALGVAVHENYVTVDDGIIRTGNPTFTVQVLGPTDFTGGTVTVPEATTQSFSLDDNGTATVSLTSLRHGFYDVVANVPGWESGSAGIIAVGVGEGVLRIDTIDESLNLMSWFAVDFLQYDQAYSNEMNGSAGLFLLPSNDSWDVIVRSGGAGTSYYLTDNVAVPDGAAANWTANAEGASTIQVSATHGGTGVAGADLFVASEYLDYDFWSPAGELDSTGQATVYVTPSDFESYFVGVIGGGVAGAQRFVWLDTTSTPPSTEVELTFAANDPVITTSVPAANSGATATGRLLIELEDARQTLRGQDGALSFTLQPGRHHVETQIRVQDSTHEWEYSFMPTTLDGGNYYPRFVAGGTYQIAVDTQLSPILVVNPHYPRPMTEVWTGLNMEGLSSRMTYLSRRRLSDGYWDVPAWIEIWQGTTRLQRDNWSDTWRTLAAGTYEIEAAYTDLGPFLSTSLEKAATRTLYVSPDMQATVTIFDDAGAGVDRVIPADSQPHTVTVWVHDSANHNFEGVPIWLDVTLQGETDPDGKLSFVLSGDSNQERWIGLPGFDNTWISEAVAIVEPGFGAVELNGVDPYGERFSDVNLDLKRNMTNASPWHRYWNYANERWTGIAETGEYRAFVTAQDSDGTAYQLRLGTQTVPEQGRLVIEADTGSSSMNLQPLKVHATGDVPLAYSAVWVSSQQDPVRLGEPIAYLDENGLATVYVNPAPDEKYAVALADGEPAVAGFFRDLSAGTTENSLSFAGAPTLNLAMAGPDGTEWSDEDFYFKPADWPNDYMAAGILTGPVLMKPGTYELAAASQIYDETTGEVWYYRFLPLGLSPASNGSVTFAPGDAARTFQAGGPLTAEIVGEEQVQAGNQYWHGLNMDARDPLGVAHARLVHVESEDENGYFTNRMPTATLSNSDGTVVVQREGEWGLSWTPATGGYTFSADWENPGPYLGHNPIHMTKDISTAQAYTFNLDHNWISKDSPTPVTAQVMRDGTALAGAVLQLPPEPGSTVGPTVTTGEDGRATFTLHPQSGGAEWIQVKDGTQIVGSFPVLVTDQRKGVIHVTVTDAGTPAVPEEIRTLPLQNGLYDEHNGMQGLDRSFILVPAGTYGVTAASRYYTDDPNGDPYFLATSGIVVGGNAQKDVSFDLANTQTLGWNVSVLMPDGSESSPEAGIDSIAIGPTGRAYFGSQVQSVRVMDGEYGLAFYDPDITYVAFADNGISAGNTYVHSFNTADMGTVSPVAVDGNGEDQTLTVLVQSNGAGIGLVLVPPFGPVRLTTGDVTLRGYRVEVPGATSGSAWEYAFTGRDPASIVQGANPTVWQDLGGELTPELTGLPSSINPGQHLNLEFKVTTPADDRLLWIKDDQKHHQDTALLTVSDGDGNVVLERGLWLGNPTGIDLPGDLAPGAYTAVAEIEVGAYQSTPVSLTRTLTVNAPAPQITFSLSENWIRRDTPVAQTAHLAMGETAMAGAVLELPPGTRVNGAPAPTVTTDLNGDATFTLNPQWSGPQWIKVRQGEQFLGAIPVLVADDKWGVVHVNVTANGTEPAPGQPGDIRLLPKIVPESGDPFYGARTGVSGWNRNFINVPAGTYGVTAASSLPVRSGGYFLAQSDVVVPANDLEEVTFNLAGTQSLSWDVHLKESDDSQAGVGATIDTMEMGAYGRAFFDPGVNSVQVLPGSYGLSFASPNADNSILRVAFQGNLSPGADPFTRTYNIADMGRVSPVARDGSGQARIPSLVIQSNGAPLGWIMDTLDQEFQFSTGNVALRGYSVLVPGSEAGGHWTYDFTGRAQVLVEAGDNPDIWQNLGGSLTAQIGGLPNEAQAGNHLSLGMQLQNAALDKLLSIQDDHGNRQWVTYSVKDPTNKVIYSNQREFGQPLDFDLPLDGMAGTYVVEATVKAGPYFGGGSYVASKSLLVTAASGITVHPSPADPGWKVLPSGNIEVRVHAFISDISSVQANVTFNPDQVTYVQAALPDGGTIDDSSTPGQVRWSWSCSSDCTGSDRKAVLTFQAKTGVVGKVSFGMAEGSSVSNGIDSSSASQGGSVEVAATGVSGVLQTEPFASVPVIVVEGPNGFLGVANVHQEMANESGQVLYALADVPTGMINVVAASPGFLPAASESYIPEGGGAVAAYLEMTYGDADNSGAIDSADLDLLASMWRQGDGPVSSVYTHGTVDLKQLARVARNVGATSAVSSSLVGSVQVTVPQVTGSPVAAVWALRFVPWMPQPVGAAVGPITLSSSTSSSATLQGLPPGDYLVHVVTEENQYASDVVTVTAGETSQVPLSFMPQTQP